MQYLADEAHSAPETFDEWSYATQYLCPCVLDVVLLVVPPLA